MLAQAAIPLDLSLTVLDRHRDCPASIATHVQTGSLTDADALRRLAESVECVTFEIEHTNTDALETLQAAGHLIRPAPAVLALVSDKLIQKKFLIERGIPTAPLLAEHPADSERIASADGMQKARRGGYDGKGVARVHAGGRLPIATPSFIEERIDFASEIAVIGCRFGSGEIRLWEPVLMQFDPEKHLVNEVVWPSGLSTDLNNAATELARTTIDAFGAHGHVGVMAVEMFLTRTGSFLVNEVAPRPHNAGHLTIEGSVTSQFQQHLRAVAGLPPGSTEMRAPCAMRNLLASATHSPDAVHRAVSGSPVSGIETALAYDGVYLHLYGKQSATPGRKMGHITAVHHDRETARRLAREAESSIAFGDANAQKECD
jgi:5-(carboxyamino)imidazole ribonucleotide synthase